MSPDERQRNAPAQAPNETVVRGLSILIAGGILVWLAVDPAIAGSTGNIGERVAGAVLLVGAVATAVRGFGVRGQRSYLRFLTRPSVCWSLAAAGLVIQVLV